MVKCRELVFIYFLEQLNEYNVGEGKYIDVSVILVELLFCLSYFSFWDMQRLIRVRIVFVFFILYLVLVEQGDVEVFYCDGVNEN